MGNCLNCEESSEAGEGVDGPLLIQGQKVERFTVAVNPSEPKVILRWDPPTDCDVTDIRAYDVRFKKLGALQYNELQVGAAQTTCTLSLNSGLEPLSSTQFEVRAIQEAGKAGEWTSESLLVGNITDDFFVWPRLYFQFNAQIGTASVPPVERTGYESTMDNFTTSVAERVPDCTVCIRPHMGGWREREGGGCWLFSSCIFFLLPAAGSRHCMYPSCPLLKEGDNWYCSGHKDEALQSGNVHNPSPFLVSCPDPITP